jgi:NAD(P)-dependent dehydrogenase (short-subunit alcohol dehydrogenase family)
VNCPSSAARSQRACYDEERTRAWLRRNTPLPGDGTVDGFVGAVLWLVSDAGRYVTGQTIVIDGGWTAR